MAKNRPLKVTARVVEAALAKAEEALVRPTGRDAPFVDLKPSEVETRTELFQPRKFSEGLRDVDPKHVKDLGIRIGKKGELDPITVVKIGTGWVCVDGHHRLAAYVARKWTGTIRCEWFPGSATEARDAGLLKNEVAKLPMQQSDRFEEAWKRVVMQQGSKREIVRITGASDGMVALMRRVVASYRAQDLPGQRLKKRINDLGAETWSSTRAAWVGLEAGEFDAQEEAAKLARILANRLTNKLSKNAEVTARALWMYDPLLCEPLSRALISVMDEDADREAVERMERLTTPEDDELVESGT
ncbi:ParB-like nuclease domain-containing protein [Bradyrhizobium sp. 190]|uniref:ParB/RepB/Spo0J family partition protein n=1 Tax=Bradyrhizobium sp. 190 TaxID=2782658 RepID=UPI001FF8DA17|nr:ParB/RepB/Spo0J family partition protein [Bradyrhizobium sp. 190]MCK1518626.1 ParB-like nuclease domain-containing protein [Bradyrhizobium sp. 190]